MLKLVLTCLENFLFFLELALLLTYFWSMQFALLFSRFLKESLKVASDFSASVAPLEQYIFSHLSIFDFKKSLYFYIFLSIIDVN